MPHRLDVTAGGVRLACRVRGALDAPPLVLLHGLGLDGGNWDGVAPQLAELYRVFALDLRGHGDSDHPGEYSFELMASDVLGTLDQLGLGQITLIAHSMGGTVAYLVAEQQPGRIRRMIIEDTAPPRRPDRPRPVPEREPGPLPLDWAVIPAVIQQLNEPDPAWWDRLTEITAPTLIIGGGPDSHNPQAELAEAAARMPDATVVTIPAGHHVHSSRPAEFTAAALAFLRG